MPGGRRKQSLSQRTSLLSPDLNFLLFKKNKIASEGIIFEEIAPSPGGGEVIPPSPPPPTTSNLLTQAGNTLITQAGNNLILN